MLKYPMFIDKAQMVLLAEVADKVYHGPVSYTHLTLPTTPYV